MHRFDALIKGKEAELERDKSYRAQLLELKAEGILTRDEFIEMKDSYSEKIRKHEGTLAELEKQRQEMVQQGNRGQLWLKQFSKHYCFDHLTREAVITFIERVKVFRNKEIEITFAMQDEYQTWLHLMQEMQKGVG